MDWLHLLADTGLIRQRGGAFVLGSEPPACDDNELAVERVKALWPLAGALFAGRANALLSEAAHTRRN